MSVKVETLITRADEKTTDFTLHVPQPPLSLSDPGIQRMQQDNAAGLQIASAYPQPEEVHPRSAGSGSNHVPLQQRDARVPIPPASASHPQVSAQATGPMSSSVVVPERPKPGRKPIPHEDTADRRRLQNRMAQRHFRDKRQQKLADTQVELEQRKREYQKEINELERKLDAERREKQDLAAQNESLTARLRDAELRCEESESKLRQTQPFTNSATSFFGMQNGAAPSLSVNTNQRTYGGYGAASHPTPPEDSAYGHLEQDFTCFRPSQQSNSLRQTISNDGSAIGFGTNAMSGDCGFCTDDQNCACKQESQVAGCAPVPGTCAACRTDPARAAVCRELATVAQFSARPSTAEGPRLFDTAGSMSMQPPRMSCSQLVGQFRQYGERTSSISDLFGGPIRAYPNAEGGGYGIDQQEAAQVLQTLSRRNTLVSPTESNERSAASDGSRRGNGF